MMVPLWWEGTTLRPCSPTRPVLCSSRRYVTAPHPGLSRNPMFRTCSGRSFRARSSAWHLR
eukprot:2183251-Lingulodinium_polyedra.AAC.1